MTMQYLYADPVTPDNNNDLAKQADAIVAAAAGNVSVDPASGGTAVVIGLAAGQILPLPIKRVRSTSTTATGIVALRTGPRLAS